MPARALLIPDPMSIVIPIPIPIPVLVLVLVLLLIDTIKTRLQSQAGFMASGGFRGVYSGLLSAVIGSAPNGMARPGPQGFFIEPVKYAL